MKKSAKQLLAALSLALFLCLFAGCQNTNLPSEPTVPEAPSVSIETTAAPTETAAPETTIPEMTVPETEPATEPEHSALYLPDVSVEDMILYFNEVCLDAEFVNSGDASRLQKWTAPISYALHGDYTDQDLATLSAFVAWLNALEGFPGISEAPASDYSNLQIHFCTQSDMVDLMGDNFYGMDGAVTFWYSDDEIYDAIICYRTDVDQYLRNSVILEEIYNGLGPIQDTALRPDSIIYSDFSEPQWLSPIDEVILQLLYHPDILPGMDAQQCEQVIRSLYY